MPFVVGKIKIFLSVHNIKRQPVLSTLTAEGVFYFWYVHGTVPQVDLFLFVMDWALFM